MYGQQGVGHMYQDAGNNAVAIEWYKKSAAQGCSDAKDDLERLGVTTK